MISCGASFCDHRAEFGIESDTKFNSPLTWWLRDILEQPKS
jgi:hypothetical protein